MKVAVGRSTSAYEDTTSSSSKIPIFSGMKKDWDVWSEKFLARAKYKGYKDVLVGKVQLKKLSQVDESKGLTKEEKEANDLND